MDDKFKLEEKIVCKNCVINTYIARDEKNYILQIDYLQGKFVSEKIFTNDLNGIELMEEAKDLFKTEYDIRGYFGII